MGICIVQILESGVGRAGFAGLAPWKKVPEEIVEEVPEEIM
jgi:hypothetical protein